MLAEVALGEGVIDTLFTGRGVSLPRGRVLVVPEDMEVIMGITVINSISVASKRSRLFWAPILVQAAEVSISATTLKPSSFADRAGGPSRHRSLNRLSASSSCQWLSLPRRKPGPPKH